MRRAWLVVIAVAAACGDNRAAPIDSPVAARHTDAPAALDGVVDPDSRVQAGPPDLVVEGSLMDESLIITDDTFEADDCEIAEMCVGGTGTRRLLRFDAVIANLGSGDLVMGAPPPPGVSNATFTWSPCHMHHHVNGFAEYQLSDGSGVVVTGRKNAFCLTDTEQIVAGDPSDGYTCTYQGISVGWADVYTRYLACQWLDITEVPSGTYTLTVTVNPDGLIEESDTTNDSWSKQVTF